MCLFARFSGAMSVPGVCQGLHQRPQGIAEVHRARVGLQFPHVVEGDRFGPFRRPESRGGRNGVVDQGVVLLTADQVQKNSIFSSAFFCFFSSLRQTHQGERPPLHEPMSSVWLGLFPNVRRVQWSFFSRCVVDRG